MMALQQSLKDLRVLVVDDESDNVDVLARIVRAMGGIPVTASSGSGAIDLLDSQSFSLGLVDIQMGEVSGRDVIRHIRQRTLPMRVIAVTGLPRESRAELIRIGFDEYYNKPISVLLLAKMVTHLVEAV